MTSPRIYVACLASYNAGKLHGAWIAADQDVDAIQEEIAAMLRASPCPNVEVDCPECSAQQGCPVGTCLASEPCVHGCTDCKGTRKVPSAEEFAIHDHEEFGGIEFGEYESIERVAMFAELLSEHDAEIVKVALEHCSSNADAKEINEWISECYAGSFRTLEDWAEEFLEDTGGLSDMPENLKPYFDFEKWARDAEMGGDIFTVDGGRGVHVFWNR